MSERREGQDQLVEDTGWLDLDHDATDDFAWRDRELPTIWRNDPLSVPRTSALPRGGLRTVIDGRRRPAAVAPGQVDHTAPRAPRDYSQSLDYSRVPVHLAWAIRRVPTVAARPGPQEGRQDDSASDSDSQDENSDSAAPSSTRPDGPTIMDQLVRDAASFFATARRSRPPPESSSSSSSSRPRPRAREGGASPPPVQLEQGDEEEVDVTFSAPPPRRRRTREETNAMMGAALRSKKFVYLLYCGNDGSTLIDDDDDEEEEEEGGGAGPSSGQGRRLPTGFHPGVATMGTGGCGALVCARALLDGVPNMIFRDSSASDPDSGAAAADTTEERAASSDLPPRADRVADLFEGDGVGERVGRRGWKRCRGGNVLGYRLLRPCVSCSISRPTYTTYASVVTNNDPASSSSTSTRGGETRGTLSAGGVTGGGVVDGLLFHFKLAAVTPVRRRIGIPPAEELLLSPSRYSAATRSNWSDPSGGTRSSPTTTSEAGAARGAEAAQQQQGRGGGGRNRTALPARLREKPARVGDKMSWRHIPTAQRDFVSGLVGEPSDWISPSSETWWLDHAIVKHSRKRSAGAAFADPNSFFNPDSLSSARTTTVDPSGGVSRTSPANSPLRSSLSRSHAIRVRVPLSNPHPASALATSSGNGEGGAGRQQQQGGSESATASYDRYRSDASDFARRVRQRYADPSASDSAVVTSLERAGYGSGFAAEEEEDDERGGGAPCSNCAHSRGREVIGR
ncbi:hypothetical protein RHOSPDRAFT_33173 [Rhodotorula sp. JG-1b]|nr:hypothetical protein RHOSPDRAFT_33173 [Rhodotorula sp. JG-1b]